VASEAVTNAIKYASARTIALTVNPAPGGVVIQVRDDGRGGAVVGTDRASPGSRTGCGPSAASYRSLAKSTGHIGGGGAAVRIVIAEDAALFRHGLSLLLQDGGHQVVATAQDADSARQAVSAQRPDLVILDARMPPRHDDDGAQLAAELRRGHPRLPVVLLSQHVEVRHIVSLATAGYFGYLLKDRVLDVDDFLEALERVARGGSVLDPEVVGQLVAANRDSGVLAALTEREQEVLSLMAEG
jgi:DNA-binding NarL/FixJ family response regulator